MVWVLNAVTNGFTIRSWHHCEILGSHSRIRCERTLGVFNVWEKRGFQCYYHGSRMTLHFSSIFLKVQQVLSSTRTSQSPCRPRYENSFQHKYDTSSTFFTIKWSFSFSVHKSDHTTFYKKISNIIFLDEKWKFLWSWFFIFLLWICVLTWLLPLSVGSLTGPPHPCHLHTIPHGFKWVERWSHIQICELVVFFVHFTAVVIVNNVANFLVASLNYPVMSIEG